MEDLTKNQTKNSGERMGFLNIKQTGEFSEQFGNFTAEQVRDFTNEKNEDSTKTFDEKLTAFTNEKTGIFSELPNVDLNNKQLFEDFIKKPMRDLTKEQVPVGTLSKEQTREFTPIQSKNFDEERMKDLTDTHLGEFTNERIGHFHETLNYEQLFGDCTKEQIKDSTKERMGKLTPKHARNFDEERIEDFTEELLGNFDKNQMNGFTEEQIKNFTEEQTIDFTEEIGDSTDANAQDSSYCSYCPIYNCPQTLNKRRKIKHPNVEERPTGQHFPFSWDLQFLLNSAKQQQLQSGYNTRVPNCAGTDLYDNLLESAGDHLPVVKIVPPAAPPPVVPMRSKKLF